MFVFVLQRLHPPCCDLASLPQRDTLIKMCLVDYKMLFLGRVIRNKINLWPSLSLSLFPFHPLPSLSSFSAKAEQLYHARIHKHVSAQHRSEGLLYVPHLIWLTSSAPGDQIDALQYLFSCQDYRNLCFGHYTS